MWCNICGVAAGEIWNWSLLGVKGLRQPATHWSPAYRSPTVDVSRIQLSIPQSFPEASPLGRIFKASGCVSFASRSPGRGTLRSPPGGEAQSSKLVLTVEPNKRPREPARENSTIVKRDRHVTGNKGPWEGMWWMDALDTGVHSDQFSVRVCRWEPGNLTLF